MRRFFRYIGLILAGVLFFSACAQGPASSTTELSQNPTISGAPPTDAGAEIALLTSTSRLESPFGQAVWNAITLFAGENGITTAPYRAEEDDAVAALLTLELAVRGGARLAVVMGESVTLAAGQAAAQYPDVDFLLLDAPFELEGGDNCSVVQFPLAQAGWLAGYLAATEAAGAPLALVQSRKSNAQLYSLGFLMGLQQALEEQEPAAETPQVVYPLLFTASTSGGRREELLDAACAAGTAVLFVADPAYQTEALAAAYSSGARVMGIDLPLGTASQALASAEQAPAGLVTQVLNQWANEHFPGPRPTTGSLINGDMELKAELARFDHIGERSYAAALNQLRDGPVSATLNARLRPGPDGNWPTADELGLNLIALQQPDDEQIASSGATFS